MPSLLKFQSLSDIRLEFEGSQINNLALETYCQTILKLEKITYLELNIGRFLVFIFLIVHISK